MNLKREKATGSSPVATKNKTTIDCNTVFYLFKRGGAK